MPQAWDNPDVFVGRSTMSAFEPYPFVTGSLYSSVPPQSAAAIRWVQPNPLAIKNLYLQNSMSVSVPAATSQASTGSEAFSYGLSAFFYSRQDYSANSTNLTPVISASFGLTANMGYSSTSQTYGMSWVTNSSGGTSSFSTSSNDGGWSNYASSGKLIVLPVVTTLPAGEYWAAFQHSSTSATSNSNVTLLSMSQLLINAQQAQASFGLLGASVGGLPSGANQNIGAFTSTPVWTTTVSIPAAAARPVWFAMSNA